MRVAREKHVYQLAFLPALFPINCYLVEEQDSLTLVDAGLPFCVKGIVRTAAAIGKPLARIVLTHAHGDHIGALDLLKQQLPQASVYISARDSRLLAGDRSLLPGEPESPVRGGAPRPGQIRTTPDILLRDGDRIGSLVALAAPRHTPGSMAYLDTRSRALLCGDAFQVRGGIAVSGQLKPLFPFPAMATWNKEQALITARRLLDQEPELLASGHGRMLRQPYAAMGRAVAAAEWALGIPASAGRGRTDVSENRR
ncbi:MAG: hypothetical protein K0R57_821 [Paenibacillaceae bacterium]|nr:hypothetical protein [Paenibacillaceae bacterium]